MHKPAPPPMALPPLLLALLLLASGSAAAPQANAQDTAAIAPAPAPAPADGPDTSPGDPALIEAEAAWLREADTALLAGQLARMLRQGAAFGPGPTLGEADNWGPTLLLFDGAAGDSDPAYALDQDSGTMSKRSRYYRRYPWKRQPGRGGGAPVGDMDNPYLCNPTREDVFQLLVALHEARAGNLGRTVSFCNRRRPAASVFTNIRFLGRRRRR